MPGTVFEKKGKRVRLGDISAEPPKGMTRAKAEERFKVLGQELFDLQDRLWGAKTRSVMVVLQGRDSAGKDGAIKHVVGYLNPRGVNVVSFGVPTTEERQHDFLWRVHRHAPRAGEFAIFNRSHYEDVLVVRVHDLVPKSLWRERYGHIADFEELLHEHGTIVLKFFLHISKKEQEQRLLEREEKPETAWKLNPGDWKEREYWDEYAEAYEDAIEKTASPHAPWIVVPANAKWYRNLVVAEAIVAALRPYKKEWKAKLDQVGVEGKAELDRYRRSVRATKASEEEGQVSATHEGGCTCGAVRYRMTSGPLFVNCCHCTWCQRETGSAFAINAMIEADRVQLLAGEPEAVMTPSNSGKGQKIWRCPTCRVALWSNYAGAGDAVRFVRVGTLDEPGRLPPDIHIFTTTKQPWVVFPPGARVVEEYYDSKTVWPPESLERRKHLRKEK